MLTGMLSIRPYDLDIVFSLIINTFAMLVIMSLGMSVRSSFSLFFQSDITFDIVLSIDV